MDKLLGGFLLLFAITASPVRAYPIIDLKATYETLSVTGEGLSEFEQVALPVDFDLSIELMSGTFSSTYQPNEIAEVSVTEVGVSTGQSPFSESLVNLINHRVSPSVSESRLRYQETEGPVSLSGGLRSVNLVLAGEQSETVVMTTDIFEYSRIDYRFLLSDPDVEFSGPIQLYTEASLIQELFSIGQEYRLSESFSELLFYLSPPGGSSLRDVTFRGRAVVAGVRDGSMVPLLGTLPLTALGLFIAVLSLRGVGRRYL